MAETGKRDDPYQQFNFLVEIDNITRAGFMECSGLTTDNDAIDYREGNDIKMNVRKLSGLRKYTNIVLKRGYTQNLELWKWRNSVIQLLDEDRNVVMRWMVEDAWISKWESGPFNAKTNDVAVETVELVHEGLKLVFPA
jgi:phage tail-like protein